MAVVLPNVGSAVGLSVASGPFVGVFIARVGNGVLTGILTGDSVGAGNCSCDDLVASRTISRNGLSANGWKLPPHLDWKLGHWQSLVLSLFLHPLL